jgi:Family of unknown function (DUF6081)
VTVVALERDAAGIFNVVDDDPAPVREWLPVLADALGAKPPRRFPRRLARLVAGEAAIVMGTESRGGADSPKYLVFSTRRFDLLSAGPATFAVDLAVENIGGDPGDFRLGMAAFHVFDLDVTQRVFAACGTATRVFALHEQLGLGGGGAGEPFYYMVESPHETSTTTSPTFARARSRSTGAHRPRPGASTAARCTRRPAR